MPAVSVVLPARDAEATLRESLQSILAQDFGDIEVVVVDDGSRDATGEVARSTGDPRVRVIRTGGVGPAAASAAGVAACEGALVARMDADDVALPRRLSSEVALLRERPEVAAAGCRIRIIPREGLSEGMAEYERWQNDLVEPEEIRRHLFVELPVCQPTLLLRHEALAEAGGFRETEWPEDYDLLFRLHLRGMKVAKVPEELLLWRDRPDRLTRKSPRYAKPSFLRAKMHYLPHFFPRMERIVIWGAGRDGRLYAKAARAVGIPVDRFVDISPKRIGGEKQGCPVLAPEELRLAPGELVVTSVGIRGVRRQVYEELVRLGFAEWEHFVLAA